MAMQMTVKTFSLMLVVERMPTLKHAATTHLEGWHAHAYFSKLLQDGACVFHASPREV